MSEIAPSTLRLSLNAGDIADYIPPPLHSRNLQSEILSYIDARRRRLFTLIAHTACSDPCEMVVRVTNVDDSVITIKCSEPPFEAGYVIATEPPPQFVQPHGDVYFQLDRV